MVKGLYTSYTGLVNQQNRLDVVTNNLANATTTGYKKEGCTTQSFDSVYGIKVKDLTVGGVNENIGKLSLGAKIGETYRDWSNGSFISTSSNYDFALSGEGMFSISFTNKLGEESTLYTRDGSFQMNSEGYLVTKDGDFVLGENGPIQLPTDLSELSVQPTGEIYADGQYIDRFALVNFEDYNYVEAYGENLYRAVDGATFTDATATVNQGYLESSNINVVSEMVDMITIAREFESNQKVMTTIDEMLGKMVNISEL
ncbi:MAG: flagellar hook-basal body protein [Lachnospira sp.]|nr:flagellar hook-basal body protein [Lachnospira sp.]MDD5828431.1 flagellar hook-basal body protein [Lachnospira sp.]